ncbi:hypothetical protein [Nocardia cyriacigeorgica]|uniref:hypothetical protein n=1 Tax=Nocardia cyriacigeorgica TaxID=135487 RepID=UPI002456A834|nr:hypothetical protein [Nocardia cyriacigeorgica]
MGGGPPAGAGRAPRATPATEAPERTTAALIGGQEQADALRTRMHALLDRAA